MYQLKSSLSITRINLGFMIHDECRRGFDLMQEAHFWWTSVRSWVNSGEFVRCHARTDETYSEAKSLFCVRNREVRMNAQSPHNWLSTLKSAVFGSLKSRVCVSVGTFLFLWCFGGFFVWSVSLLAGDRPLSPQY